jgi:hypothetical protein
MDEIYSQMLRLSDYQWQSINIQQSYRPGFNLSFPQHSGISGGADEAVLNKILLK